MLKLVPNRVGVLEPRRKHFFFWILLEPAFHFPFCSPPLFSFTPALRSFTCWWCWWWWWSRWRFFPLSLLLSAPIFPHLRLEVSQMMLMTMVMMLMTMMMNLSLPPVLPEGLSDASYLHTYILFKSWLPNLHMRYILRKYFSETLNSHWTWFLLVEALSTPQKLEEKKSNKYQFKEV